MSKQLKKSFRHGLSKIKISNKHLQHSIRSCKHVKTPSFGGGGGGDDANENEDTNAVTLSDVDQFLFDNFRSLYRKEYEADAAKKASFQFDSPRLMPPPSIEHLTRSARFFVPSRSSSSLITDDLSSVKSEEEAARDDDKKQGAVEDEDDFIAIITYSPSPYDDFRQSMEEMVEARAEKKGSVDWKFMEELLFCYLDLNSKKSHGCILRAFVDVVVLLRENSGRIPVTVAEVREGGGGRGAGSAENDDEDD